MTQYIRRERRSKVHSYIDYRSVTNRQNTPPTPVLRPSAIIKKTVSPIQQDNSFEVSPSQQNKPMDPSALKVDKAELVAPDQTAPIFIQFHKVVIKAASIILRKAGINRRDLKPAINDAFDMFYKDFDAWWKSQKRVSQRKETGNLDIEILKNQLNECNTNLGELRNQCYIWKSYKGFLEISCPHFEYQQITIPPEEKDDELKNQLIEFKNELIVVSRFYQKSRYMLTSTKKNVDNVLHILQFENLDADEKKKAALRNRLCNDS